MRRKCNTAMQRASRRRSRLGVVCFFCWLAAGSVSLVAGLTCDEIAGRTVDMNSCKLASQEGYLSVTPEGTLPITQSANDNRIYWKEYWATDQDPAKTMPILAVHGGPGGTHNYMLPLRLLACRPSPSGTHYRVIFYDQLGSGKSATREDGTSQNENISSVWYLTTELQAIVQGVVLRKNNGPFHLLGHGFGGLVALSYATVYPDFTQAKMASLILSSPAAPNMQNVVAGVIANMQAQLPEKYYSALMSGDKENPEYNDAIQSFFTRLVVRSSPVPDCVTDTLEARSDVVRTTVWGSEPWVLTGNARTVDLKRDLPRILVPTYTFIGKYDMFPASTLADLSGGTSHIPWIHTETVPDAGHVTHIDNFPFVYNGLNKWLDDTDSQPFFQAISGKESEEGEVEEEESERESDEREGSDGLNLGSVTENKEVKSETEEPQRKRWSVRALFMEERKAIGWVSALSLFAIMATVGYRRARRRIRGNELPYTEINS